MSYTAQVFNILIASPGDVQKERAITREIIYEWNTVNSLSNKIILLPLGWETHSSPDMENSPQGIINNQLLEHSDLLVGVFWNRIGTKTDRYASGTVEEIEQHIDLQKPTMLYFSDQPVKPSSINPEQRRKLDEFRESCQKRGLCETYDTIQEFEAKFRRQLGIKLNQHALFRNLPTINDYPVAIEANALSNLSVEAKNLLKEASQDPNGYISHLVLVGGTFIETNHKKLLASTEPREIAKWEKALEDLKANRLIIPIDSKEQFLKITNLGYQLADSLI